MIVEMSRGRRIEESLEGRQRDEKEEVREGRRGRRLRREREPKWKRESTNEETNALRSKKHACSSIRKRERERSSSMWHCREEYRGKMNKGRGTLNYERKNATRKCRIEETN